MSAANVLIARHGYEAIMRGELDGIEDFLDPDVEWHGGDSAAVGACHSSDDVLKFMRAALARGRVGKLLDVIDAGEQVVVVLQPPASDGVQPPPRANLTTFKDGKVVKMVAYPSPEEALAATRAAHQP